MNLIMTRDMQDKLEKFVKTNKDKFDKLTPRDSIWERIKTDLDTSSENHIKMIFWRAAAIALFVLSVGLTFYANRDSIFSQGNAVVEDDEFMTTEQYYSSIISERQDMIKAIAASYPDVETDFESDWDVLDQNYKQLKNEYKQNKSEEVLHALIQNLQARVNLLNKQMEVLREMKNEDENQVQI